jgi:hypothetical protein
VRLIIILLIKRNQEQKHGLYHITYAKPKNRQVSSWWSPRGWEITARGYKEIWGMRTMFYNFIRVMITWVENVNRKSSSIALELNINFFLSPSSVFSFLLLLYTHTHPEDIELVHRLFLVVFSAQCRIEKKIDRQIDKCIYLAQMM